MVWETHKITLSLSAIFLNSSVYREFPCLPVRPGDVCPVNLFAWHFFKPVFSNISNTCASIRQVYIKYSRSQSALKLLKATQRAACRIMWRFFRSVMLQITEKIFIMRCSRIRFSSKRPAILVDSRGIRGWVLHVLPHQSFIHNCRLI